MCGCDDRRPIGVGDASHRIGVHRCEWPFGSLCGEFFLHPVAYNSLAVELAGRSPTPGWNSFFRAFERSVGVDLPDDLAVYVGIYPSSRRHAHEARQFGRPLRPHDGQRCARQRALHGPTWPASTRSANLGYPGQYPFTRGVHASMYREPAVDDAAVRRLRHGRRRRTSGSSSCSSRGRPG